MEIDVAIEEKNISVELETKNINVSISQVSGSDAGADLNTLRNRLELEEAYKIAYTTDYKEFTYTGSDITKVEIWEDDTKAVKLFTKDITYTSGNITQTVITDEITGKVLTSTFAYSGGNISNITRSFV